MKNAHPFKDVCFLSFLITLAKQNETGLIFESITTSQIIEPIPWDQYREISILYPYPLANRDNVDNFTMRMEEVRESVEKKLGLSLNLK